VPLKLSILCTSNAFIRTFIVFPSSRLSDHNNMYPNRSAWQRWNWNCKAYAFQLFRFVGSHMALKLQTSSFRLNRRTWRCWTWRRCAPCSSFPFFWVTCGIATPNIVSYIEQERLVALDLKAKRAAFQPFGLLLHMWL